MNLEKRLTGKQVRYLRSLGHHLKPVVMVGKEGISDRLLQTVSRNLDSHELIKVRVQEGCPSPVREAAEIIAERTGSVRIQVIGKTILLFREIDREDRKIRLP